MHTFAAQRLPMKRAAICTGDTGQHDTQHATFFQATLELAHGNPINPDALQTRNLGSSSHI